MEIISVSQLHLYGDSKKGGGNVSRLMVSNLKNAITHNIAQQLVAGASKNDVYEYLGMVVEFLFSPVGEAAGLTQDDVHEIYLHAFNHGQEEADIVMYMNKRYGISIQVKGHGGSQIHPSVLLSQYLA